MQNTSTLTSHPNYSTGDTPQTQDASDAEYSPPMATFNLPGQLRSSKQMELIEDIDFVFNLTGAGELRPGDYGALKEILMNGEYEHEDFCCGLLHAAEMFRKEEKKLRPLRATSGSATEAVDQGRKGFVTGMPLTTIAWEDVNEEMLGRMSTMAVRSGILQAYGAVHDVKHTISKLESKASAPVQEAEGELMEVDDKAESDDNGDGSAGQQLPDKCKPQ